MMFSPRLLGRLWSRLFVPLVALMLGGAAWADPPGRVGRLSDIDGQVWLFSPESGEWVAAVRNQPVTTGDRLSTESSARAEVRIGSTTVRLDEGTELEVVQLDDDRMAFQLHNGSASARLRNAEAAAEFEMRTAEGTFRTQRAGRYRFDRMDNVSHATVWSGQALYEGPGSALTVHSGQRAEFWLDAGNGAQYTITEPRDDSFAAWTGERDRSDDRSASTRYVSPEMTGVEDLDRHGRWEEHSEYGALWIPRAVPVGWAPYSTGRWMWVAPWGWTWVDDAPWGFAPFHYGRWVWHRSNWCWSPGTYVARPVYAPALVAWVGGPRLSVSVAVGRAPAVGWFPLAPREVFVPSYRVSPRYVRNVNITHVTNITNINTIVNNPQQAVGRADFRNRRFPHAVTVVPQSVVAERQPVAPAAVRLRGDVGGRERAPQPTPQHQTLVAPPVAAPVAIRRLEPTRPGQPLAERPGTGAGTTAPAPGRMNAMPGQPAEPRVPGLARPSDERRAIHPREQDAPLRQAPPAPQPLAQRPPAAIQGQTQIPPEVAPRPPVNQPRPMPMPTPQPQGNAPRVFTQPSPAPAAPPRPEQTERNPAGTVSPAPAAPPRPAPAIIAPQRQIVPQERVAPRPPAVQHMPQRQEPLRPAPVMQAPRPVAPPAVMQAPRPAAPPAVMQAPRPAAPPAMAAPRQQPERRVPEPVGGPGNNRDNRR